MQFTAVGGSVLGAIQHFKLPLWLFIPVLGVVMGLVFFPKAYAVLHSGMTGKGIKGDATDVPISQAVPASPSKVNAPAVYSGQAVGALATTSESQSLPAVAPIPLQISSCLANAFKCQCYTDKAVKIPLDDAECRRSALETTTRYKLQNENHYSVASR